VKAASEGSAPAQVEVIVPKNIKKQSSSGESAVKLYEKSSTLSAAPQAGSAGAVPVAEKHSSPFTAVIDTVGAVLQSPGVSVTRKS